jgi:hypothetical protein
MVSRIVSGSALAALAGAAMLAVSSSPSFAFTLSSPSLEAPVAGVGVQKVWWDRWGRWHPNHPYWGGAYYHPYWHPYYHPYYHPYWHHYYYHY